MKKSELKKLIKEEILKESTPGFDTRNSGDPLPTLESVKAAYEAKNLKESNWSIEEENQFDDFIMMLEHHVDIARSLRDKGSNDDWDFGSLVDATRDALREFE